MALHTSLPIYKVAYDLLDLAMDLPRNMPRDLKVAVGGRIREECLDVLLLVARANKARDKAPHLDALLEHLHVAEVLLRASTDKKIISRAQYARAIALTAQVGK